jgi:REP element-mobilizing transposase RayT
MARGVERRKIFLDDRDRAGFLARLEEILPATGTRCFAFAEMPNHFHLLLETGPTPLSRVMLRIGTSHAMDFNRRHDRVGHLFQNRFKSRFVDDDGGFLAVVRYIHLNPVRAGLVPDVRSLEAYPWTGHSCLMGRRRVPFLDTATVLAQFSPDALKARRSLPAWMEEGLTGEEGVDPGLDPDLGDPLPPLPLPAGRPLPGDVLSSVEIRSRLRLLGWGLEPVLVAVCARLQVDPAPVRGGRRTGSACRAREAIAGLAVGVLGETCAAVARATGVSAQAVNYAVDRFSRWPPQAKGDLSGILAGSPPGPPTSPPPQDARLERGGTGLLDYLGTSPPLPPS